jgi:molecular chaperone DnaK
MAADNKMLGQFDLVGIPPAQRGIPQVEVTFDIDANGIVNVSAKDKATNKEQQIRIQASGGLSDADIDGMVKDAESHADEDKKRRESVEAKNQAEAMIHTTESTLSELGDQVPEEEKSAVESAIDDLKTALEGEDAEDIKAKTDALTQASMKLGELAYRNAQEEAAGAPDSEGRAKDSAAASDETEDDVVDADFTDLEVEDDEDDQKKSV